jgi:hypothetical protein
VDERAQGNDGTNPEGAISIGDATTIFHLGVRSRMRVRICRIRVRVVFVLRIRPTDGQAVQQASIAMNSALAAWDRVGWAGLL